MFALMGENGEERVNENDDQNPIDEGTTEAMTEYVSVLNAFVNQIAEMEWPESFQLDSDEKLALGVFRNFWRQRHRQKREKEENNQRFHMRFHGISGEDFHRFLRHKMSEMMGEDDAPINIDPGAYEPEQEHEDEDAKARQRRFQDEWS